MRRDQGSLYSSHVRETTHEEVQTKSSDLQRENVSSRAVYGEDVNGAFAKNLGAHHQDEN